MNININMNKILFVINNKINIIKIFLIYNTYTTYT